MSATRSKAVDCPGARLRSTSDGMFWKIVPGLTRLPSGSLASDVSARSIPSASWIGSSDRQSTACSRLRVMVDVLVIVPASRMVPSRLGRAGDMVSILTDTQDSGGSALAVGSGSHRPQTRTAAASSARTACFGDPLLTGSSYSQRCARPDFSGALRPVAPLQWTNVSRTDRLSRAQANAVAELVRVAPVVDRLGALFGAAGHRLYLVGGSVRDALLGRLGHDLDFTTDARPDTIERLLRRLTPAVWTIGKDFGTIGGRITAGHATPGWSRSPRFGPTCTPTTAASRRWCSGTPWTATWCAGTSPSTPWRSMSTGWPSSIRTAACEALAAGSLDTPATPGAVVQGRPAADAPRRPLQLAAGVHHGGAGRAGHARHGRDVSTSSPPNGSATSWSGCCSATARGTDWTCWPGPDWPTRSCRS